MGLAVGLSVSAFRLFLFHDPDARLLDYINVLLQVLKPERVESRNNEAFVFILLQFHETLFYVLRACMLIPESTGVFASVRDSVSLCSSTYLVL